MRRFLWVLLLLLLLPVCAQAGTNGNRLRLIYIAPSNPSFPTTQTINFGAETLVAAGGSPMAYVNPQLLGSTRFLGITQIVTAASTVLCNDTTSCKATTGTGGATIPFALDSRYLLVPKNLNAAYEAAWIAPATILSTCGAPGDLTNCSVTVAEYFDAGLTQPTGAVTVIKVPIIAHAAHARENAAFNRGCTANVICATTNADGGPCTPACGTNAAETNQLNALVNKTGPICAGDTVYLRTGGGTAISPTKFNPSQIRYDIRSKISFTSHPVGQTTDCTGAVGRVTFISEVIDNSTDSNGNPALKHGFQFGGSINFNSNDIGNTNPTPIDFYDVYCNLTISQPSGSSNACFTYPSTGQTGGGVGFYNSRFEVSGGLLNTSFPLPTEQFAINSYGPVVANGNHFIATGITVRAQNGGLTALTNVGENLMDDMFSIGCGNNDLESNFEFNPRSRTGNHQDFMQSVGCSTGPSTTFIEKNNLLMINQLPPLITTATGGMTTTTITFSSDPGALASGEAITWSGISGTTPTINCVSGTSCPSSHQWDGNSAVATVTNGQAVSSPTTFSLWPNDVPQCYFNANPTAGLSGQVDNPIVTNNGCYSAASNALTYSYWNNATISFNTLLTMANPGTLTVTKPLAAVASIQATSPTSTTIVDNGDGTGTVNFGGTISPGTLAIGETISGGGTAAGTKITSVLQQWANSGATPGRAIVNIGQSVGSFTALVGQSACCNVTWNRNVANTFGTAGQDGTTTLSPNPQATIAWSTASPSNLYATALPNLVGGPGPMGATNRAEGLRQMTPPFKSGALYNAGDDTYNGMLTPAPSNSNIGCWNTGAAGFDNTKTCAAQGLVQAS